MQRRAGMIVIAHRSAAHQHQQIIFLQAFFRSTGDRRSIVFFQLQAMGLSAPGGDLGSNAIRTGIENLEGTGFAAGLRQLIAAAEDRNAWTAAHGKPRHAGG